MSKVKRSVPAHWALQDAKNRFSEVVDAALGGQPQVVTRRGVETAVIISHEEYQRITRTRRGSSPSLGVHLLAIPSAEPASPDVFERIQLRPRRRS